MRGEEELRHRVLTELSLTSQSERKSWLTHPCTRAQIYFLQAELLELLEGWGSGNYTAESVEGTVQLNSEALGKYQQMSWILDWVEGIADEEMFEDDQT